MAYLKLHRYGVEDIENLYLHVFQLKIEVVESVDIDPRIFLFLRKPLNQYTNEYGADFYGIAGPVDLEEYPVGEPDPNLDYPFFRLDSVELEFRSLSQLEDTWNKIKEEVCALIDAFDRRGELVVVEEFDCGEAPADSSSSSSSESL